MSFLELKVPPPVVALTIGSGMWLAAKYGLMFSFGNPWRISLAATFVATGMFFGLGAILTFLRASTTVNPHKPHSTSTMITSGIYTISRNPMYLGVLLMLGGWAIHLSNFMAIALLPLFVVYITRFQIVPEEQALQAKFGSEFSAYMASVRRWL